MRSVTYVVNGKNIVNSVSWKIGKGEHWAVIGPNGAGKTTILRLVSGYLWPNGGGVIYRLGKALIDLRELRKSIGWVTSTLNAKIPHREIALKTVVSGKFAQIGLKEVFWEPPTERDYEQALEHLNKLGCARLADIQFGRLSQGEQQKILIARAFMTKPNLIILDEPCAGMDIGSRENFLSALQELAQKSDRSTLIYVTQHIEEIMPPFKRTLIMKEGKVVKIGCTKELIKPEMIEYLYGVKTEVVRKNGRYWLLPK